MKNIKQNIIATACIFQSMIPIISSGVDEPASETMSLLFEELRELRKINDINGSLEALNKAEREVRGQSRLSEEDLAAKLMRLAHAYLNYVPNTEPLALQKQLSLFEEISEMEVSDFRRADAYRMHGQTLLSGKNDPENAAVVYDKMLELVSNSEDRKVSMLFTAEALSKAAYAQQRLENFESSVEFREKLLDLPPDLPPVFPDGRVRALVNNARDSSERNLSSQAVSYYDQLFREHPDFGWDNGSIVSLKYERIKAFDLPEGDVREQIMLEELWRDPAMADNPRIFSVGSHVAAFYRDRHGELYIDALKELVDRLSIAYAGFSEDVRGMFSLTSLLQDSLLAFSEQYEIAENFEGAKATLEQYLQLFQDGRASEYVKSQLKRVEQKMVDIEKAKKVFCVVYTRSRRLTGYCNSCSSV